MNQTATPQEWRENLLKRLNLSMLVLGGLALLFAMFMTGWGKWSYIGIGYLCVLLFNLLCPVLTYTLRALTLILIPVLNSVLILVDTGFSAGAHLYAALGVMLSAMLLPPMISFGIFISTTLLMAIIALLAYTGLWVPANPQDYTGQDVMPWVWYVLSYVLCIGVALGSVQFISSRILVGLRRLTTSNIELERSHEAELSSLNKYRLLSENITDIVWTTDLDLKPTYVSPSIKQLGYDEKALEDQGMGLIFGDKFIEVIRERIAFDVRFHDPKSANDAMRWEAILKSKDGKRMMYELVTVFTLDEEGYPDGLISVARNIDDRLKIDNSASKILSGLHNTQSKDFFLALVTGFTQELDCRMFALAQVDPGGRSRTLAIYKDGRVLANEDFPFIAPPEANLHCPAKEMDEFGIFDKFPATEDMTRYVVCPIKVDSKPVGMLLTFHDETIPELDKVESLMRTFVFHAGTELAREREKQEKNLIQQQLFQSQKIESIGQLAGGIAHDFNNLLAVIRGNTELALDYSMSLKERDKFLSQIEKATDSAASLTAQILTFSRQQNIDPKAVDLKDAFRGLVPMLDRLLGANFELEYLPGDSVLPVKVDVSQLEQAITNLVVNARDAMESGGKVQLITELQEADESLTKSFDAEPGTYVRIRVKDTGDGIPKEMLDRIFEPYFTTKPIGRGTGFGLAVYSGIVKQHQGFYAVESTESGTIFDTYLPCTEEVAAINNKTRLTLVSGGKETILVVEDNVELSALVQRMLEDKGYRVILAPTCAEGIKLFEQNKERISLALLDVMLPDGNGFDVLAHIRQASRTLPAIFSSGFADDKLFSSEFTEYEVEVIRKPYARRHLLEKVRETIEGRLFGGDKIDGDAL